MRICYARLYQIICMYTYINTYYLPLFMLTQMANTQNSDSLIYFYFYLHSMEKLFYWWLYTENKITNLWKMHFKVNHQDFSSCF